MLIRTSVDIDAPIGRVWDLTVDVERWPVITPTMTAVERLDEGPLQAGSRARVSQPRQRPRVWTVREVDAPHGFVWDARFGTVTMTARHLLDEAKDGTRNTLELELSGLGSRLLGILGRRAFNKALTTENGGFKKAAENTAQ